ncbi:MAG: radical SAM protein [Bacteroidetes bacterium]|nr:radical SAM protein [Bacteroidota bacterium]
MYTPGYIELLNSGEFDKRIDAAEKILISCTCCPRECKINRLDGEIGICNSSALPIVSSYSKHFGEEPVISGINGAGNIFFGNCNLKCIYCQNHLISQNHNSEQEHEISIERLAEIMIELQNQNCHNIGLVSPTHFTVPILKAIKLAAENGLCLPIIFNSNGYDSVELLKFLEGIIDIYLPDFKYGNNEQGIQFSEVNNYFDKTKLALLEMFRQMGSNLIIENDIVVRGLIIRHLILPYGLSESESVFEFIANKLSENVHISLMAQYYPANNANSFEQLNRSISVEEYKHALDLLEKFSLDNGWIQDLESNYCYRPYFEVDRTNPFKTECIFKESGIKNPASLV